MSRRPFPNAWSTPTQYSSGDDSCCTRKSPSFLCWTLPQSLLFSKEFVESAFVSPHILPLCAPKLNHLAMRTSVSFLPFSFQSDRLLFVHSTFSGAFPFAPKKLPPPGFTKVPSTASDSTMISSTSAFPFGLQPPFCSIDIKPILHQNWQEEEPSSGSSQKLFRPGTLVPPSAFFLHIFFFPFQQKRARQLFFALCLPKASAALHVFFFFSSSFFHFFSFHFFLNSAPCNWFKKLSGPSLWLSS